MTDRSFADRLLNTLTNSTTKNSSTVKKNELAKIYTQAIAEFIKISYKRNQNTFDTLYFGKHKYGQADDFPDIELPTTIENTQIRLVTSEVGQKKQAENKSLVYVNMMGWVDEGNAQFTLIVFANGFEHQYDYFINLNFDTRTNKFVLDKVDFVNYLNYNVEKPKRINLFKYGKYVEAK